LNFALDHQTNLHSHYPDKGVYLTEEEMHFRKRWGDFKLAWELQPKAEIIRLGLHDTLVTDYLLTHSDGRQIQLAILGYWHRQMLMRKLELLREHAEQPILLAVPSRMHITQQEQTADTERGIYFYKDVIHPKRIAELAEELSCNAT
jgi:predicted nuclease of restriction endonuclease-like RecB superfamily